MPLCSKCKKAEGAVELRKESTCWDCFDSFFDKTFRSSLGKCIPHAPHGTKAAKPADGRSCPQARPAPPAKALALVRSTYSSVLLVDTLCRLLKLARAAPASAVDRTPPFRNLSLDIAFVDEFPFVPRQQTADEIEPLKGYFSRYRANFNVITLDGIAAEKDITAYLATVIAHTSTREQKGYVGTFRTILRQRVLNEYAAKHKYEYVILPTTGSDACGNVLGFVSSGLAAHAALAAAGGAPLLVPGICPEAPVNVCQPLLAFLDDELRLAVARRGLEKALKLGEAQVAQTPLTVAKSFVSGLALQFAQTPFNVLSTGAFMSRNFKKFCEGGSLPLCTCCGVEPVGSPARAVTPPTKEDGKRVLEGCCAVSAPKRLCLESTDGLSEQVKASERQPKASSLCPFCANFFKAFSDVAAVPRAFGSTV